MAEARALGVFQERLKSLLGSLLEVLLVEITEAYRESLADSMSMNHCEWCANNRPENRNHKGSKVRVTSGDSQPLMSFRCSDTAIDPKELETAQNAQENLSPYPAQESPAVFTEAPEWKEIQLTVVEDTTEPEPEQDLKQEYEDVAVTNEGDEWEVESFEETQACQTLCESIGAQLKPEDELHEPEESFQPGDSCPRWCPASLSDYFSQITQSRLVNVASGESLRPLQKQEDFDLSDPPLRPCTVQLCRAKMLQRPISQSKRFHVCTVCNKIFIYKRSLRRHRRFHTGERPHGCSLCSKAFILRKTLRQHTKAHYKRPYSCTQCGKRFKHWRKLRLHWRSHAGESPFVCGRCGKCCKTLKSLDRHLAYVDHD
ncbi:hypothetical protein QQF64_029463 [Cirrhinus molitorella]|uniref:C2H2-type domain-containing protein n=1 Tax=Cirrhinus molitorella TaxID=172907 RepID=A0ABR3N0U2_9TELE